MHLTLLINRNFLYHFQFYLIGELIEKYPDVKIHLLVVKQHQVGNDYVEEQFYRIIDRRFTNFIANPLAKVDMDEFSQKYPDFNLCYELRTDEWQSDWTIYLYPNPKIELAFIGGTGNILKLNLDEEYWFQSSILKHDHTRIEILKFDRNTAVWSDFHSISFATQKGIYNNRAKALYYYSLLICQAIGAFPTGKTAKDIEILNTNKRISVIPVTMYYLSLLSIILLRKLNRKKLNWKIAIRQNNQLQFINQPAGSFWADPFPVLKEDKRFVFIEEYNYATNLGEIALLELDDQLNVKQKSTLIKEDFHLSFPNVFRMEQEYYMMPETSFNNKLLIYKSNDFPNHWTVCKELMTGVKLVDAVWVFHEGLYWLFANKIHTFEADNNECLYLYYSTDLFSNNWQPHPQNPIVVNLTNARNAGQIFRENGKLYRPSQNCEKSYGAAIVINEITTLTTENYSEKVIRSILPEKPYQGLHTYNRLNELEVIDYLKEE